MPRTLRLTLLIGAGAIALSACGTLDGDSAATAGSAAPVAVPTVAASPVEDLPSGLVYALGGPGVGLPQPAVPLGDLRSGGPPPDGIPSIDEPRFLSAGDVDFLADNEPVLALEMGGEARAYPVQVLIWHEIVNDTVAGVPVAVTYCPLCNSAVAYDRRVGERMLTFGTSGLLWNSALVMYDRQTETLWSHFTGQGIVGVLTGTELDTVPVATVPWSAWRDAHPAGLVLSRDTGHDRDYGRNPYPGYDDVTSQPFLFEGEVDGRYTAMTRVVGVERDGAAIAVPLADLRERRVIPIETTGGPLVAWWSPGTASALDAAEVATGADVGATGVFVPIVDGRLLTFRAEASGFVDDETGSTWNLLGRAMAGPLAGSSLVEVPHVDTFWFAWSTFRPDTVVAGTGG
jgi:hypothetical protein